MAYIPMKEHTAASVPTPGVGKKMLYFDDSGDLLKYKDESAVTRTLSFNDSVYKEVVTRHTRLAADQAAATLQFGGEGAVAVASGTALATAGIVNFFYLDDADYTVNGLTTKFRVRASLAANATQPTITFTVGLYPVTVAGIADNLTFTLGTVVASSTVAFSSPAASTLTAGTPSSDFNHPGDGHYCFGVVTNNTLTNNSAVEIQATLQTRNV